MEEEFAKRMGKALVKQATEALADPKTGEVDDKTVREFIGKILAEWKEEDEQHRKTCIAQIGHSELSSAVWDGEWNGDAESDTNISSDLADSKGKSEQQKH